MALLFWDEIYMPIPTAIVNHEEELDEELSKEAIQKKLNAILELNGAPYDLFIDDRFMLFRNELIMNKKNNLIKESKETIKEILIDSYKAHKGTFDRIIEDWDRYSIDEICKGIDFFPVDTIIKICYRIIGGIYEYRSGLPDLIVFDGQKGFFSEVKSENDKLSDKQIIWIDYLTNTLKEDVELFLINHSEKKINNIKKKINKEISI